MKLYGAYDFPFGTQFGAFFYGGSGTPVYTYVTSTHSADLFVEGRNGCYDNGRVTEASARRRCLAPTCSSATSIALRAARSACASS